MRNKKEIESYIVNFKNKINKYTKELSNAMMEDDNEEYDFYSNQICELQSQEELLNWVLN